MFSGSWRIFWHPWDPWGRVNSGDTRVLRFVTVAPPGRFFTFMKMLPNFSFIIKVIKKSVFVSTNSQNFIVSRESHPLKAWFWKHLEQISPVWYAYGMSTSKFNRDFIWQWWPKTTVLQLNEYETHPYFLQLSPNMTTNCLFTFVFSPFLPEFMCNVAKNILFWCSEQFSVVN